MKTAGNVWCSGCYCRMCICDLHRKDREESEQRKIEREAYFAKHDWMSPEFAKQASLPMTLDVPQLN